VLCIMIIMAIGIVTGGITAADPAIVVTTVGAVTGIGVRVPDTTGIAGNRSGA
jgi:hypothetical protein